MISSTLEFHVAIIMDGNGRWATGRGRLRPAGHVAGARAVRRTVEAAPDLGITILTLYAFSSDNWRRPPSEVDHLMRLFESHLRSECDRLVENGVRLSVIGRRDRLPEGLRSRIETAEARTRPGRRLHLRIAIDYSAREALVTAAASLQGGPPPTRDAFREALARGMNAPTGTGDVDLLIRTGGEQRLSDFLLWESAYAELVFTDTLWPDFTADDLAAAVREFTSRERRFGGVSPSEGSHQDGPRPIRRAAP
ncbi:MAG: di-trans,poly-cis-decaprenylcistransferase [Gemmatimonadota bacterium]|jgi:undecaprenyl diphosphate synthase